MLQFIYYTILLLVYVGRVVCENVELRRQRPFIHDLDSEHLRVLEEYELNNGVFGSLQLRKEKIDIKAFSSNEVLE